MLLAWILAYLFRFDFDLLHKINIQHAVKVLTIVVIIYSVVFFVFRIPKIIWRFASTSELLTLGYSVTTGFLVSCALVVIIYEPHFIPLSILPLHAFFYLGSVVITRIIYKLTQVSSFSIKQRKNLIIIGAGGAAEGLLREILSNKSANYHPICLLDDSKVLQNRFLHGIKILGSCRELPNIIKKKDISLVIIAIPSLKDNKLLNYVMNICVAEKIKVRVLPGLENLTAGKISINTLREVAVEDLLGREPVKLINKDLISILVGKVVLVTGGGGSIGSELCRQIALNKPKILFILDNNEFNLYKIEQDLGTNFPGVNIKILLIDITNYSELSRVLYAIGPHIIFHAAAFKHVPMLEEQVLAAVNNNSLATAQLVDLADKYEVESFVFISTDKAVNPANIMGASKRAAEIYCQTKNQYSKTNYITVRFGNVLGSTGSVLPLFTQQLQAGGPLTVTHPNMTRYFMMIHEAVALILKSLLIKEVGSLFFLDMGMPVNILDLAKKMILLSGKEFGKDIEIKITGIRAGEKLQENLYSQSEQMIRTSIDKISAVRVQEMNLDIVCTVFANMNKYYKAGDSQRVVHEIFKLVPEYRSCENSSDVKRVEVTG